MSKYIYYQCELHAGFKIVLLLLLILFLSALFDKKVSQVNPAPAPTSKHTKTLLQQMYRHQSTVRPCTQLATNKLALPIALICAASHTCSITAACRYWRMIITILSVLTTVPLTILRCHPFVFFQISTYIPTSIVCPRTQIEIMLCAHNRYRYGTVLSLNKKFGQKRPCRTPTQNKISGHNKYLRLWEGPHRAPEKNYNTRDRLLIFTF